MAYTKSQQLNAAVMRHLLFDKLQISSDSDIYVALSGGVDSVVLLHLIHQYQNEFDASCRITALHFNHGINENAQDWADFCQQLCQDYAIPFHQKSAKIRKRAQHSLEAQARKARYQWFVDKISALSNNKAVLLTAHHQNDQSETILLQLSQGRQTSLGMPSKRQLSKKHNIELARPLLLFSRMQIEEYAQQNYLAYIEDPSNQDLAFDRNFLRHHIIPNLEQRWPNWRQKVARLADVYQQRQHWQNIYFAQLIADRALPNNQTIVCLTTPIDYEVLTQFNRQFSHDLLSYWLSTQALSLPSYRQIDTWLDQIKVQKSGYCAIIQDDYSLYYFNNAVYLVSENRLSQLTALANNDQPIHVVAGKEYTNEVFTLSFSQTNSAGIDVKWLAYAWQIRFVKGGDSFQLKKRPCKTLKSLYQEKHVPKWMRQIMPAVYIDNEIAFVPGIGVAEKFLADNIGLLPEIHAKNDV